MTVQYSCFGDPGWDTLLDLNSNAYINLSNSQAIDNKIKQKVNGMHANNFDVLYRSLLRRGISQVINFFQSRTPLPLLAFYIFIFPIKAKVMTCQARIESYFVNINEFLQRKWVFSPKKPAFKICTNLALACLYIDSECFALH